MDTESPGPEGPPSGGGEVVPEEMYQTLDETSLEHWVMELPEDEAACEWSPCNHPAAWRYIHLCCGAQGSLCDACKPRCVAWCEGNPWTCKVCKATGPGQRWVSV